MFGILQTSPKTHPEALSIHLESNFHDVSFSRGHKPSFAHGKGPISQVGEVCRHPHYTRARTEESSFKGYPQLDVCVKVRYNSNVKTFHAMPHSALNLKADDQLRIGDVAHLTGLTQRTIRYYEELGLLPPPGRTQGDFRLYTALDVRRLSEISRLKDLLGFSLAEIKQIVEADEALEHLKGEIRVAGDARTRLEKLSQFEQLTLAQLAILDRRMAQMADMKAELENRLSRCRERIREALGAVDAEEQA